MTEGRFETIHNLRAKNWDNRRHWTNWHHLYDCEADHLQRESAPFHDLRSGGQFQYEFWGAGPAKPMIEPTKLNDRPAGDRMDFQLGPGTQVGGNGDIPLDTEPTRKDKVNKPTRHTALFTKKKPLNRGLFSTYSYMPEGPPEKEKKPAPLNATTRGAVLDDNGQPRAGGMRAGPCDAIPMAEHIPDPFNDKIDRGRIHHLKAGPLTYRPEDRRVWMPEGEKEKKKRRPVGPFRAGMPHGFSINGHDEWIPDPYDMGKIKSTKRPFRTWHTRTKWSMPTHAPWSTGKITAEPYRGPGFDVTDPALPSLNTFSKANMTQTIGREAALEGITAPDRVRFR